MRKVVVLCLTLFSLALVTGAAQAGGAGCNYEGWKATEKHSPSSVDKVKTASPDVKPIKSGS